MRVEVDGVWRTINGAKVFISSRGDVIMGMGKGKESEQKPVEEPKKITIDSFDSKEIEIVKNSSAFAGFSGPSYNKVFRDLGYTDEEIQQLSKLLSDYGLDAGSQKEATDLMLGHIKEGTRIGELLRLTSDMEELSLKTWISGIEGRITKELDDAKWWWNKTGHYGGYYKGSEPWNDSWSDVEESIRYKYNSLRNLPVYRKGDVGKPIESWTQHQSGANVGGFRLTPDKKSSISEMHKKGYQILGGFSRMMGAPGEGEITFINFDKIKGK